MNAPPALPMLPEDIAGLGEVAGNLWWSWHIEAWLLFKMLDRKAWKESGHNPVKTIRMLPPETLREAAARPGWRRLFDRVMMRFRAEEGSKAAWFETHVESPDPADAAEIYDILENKVVPLYYQDTPDGIRREWAKLMKETIKSAGRRFTSRRMVREYVERFYVPALKRT